jgi:hypothetical protein
MSWMRKNNQKKIYRIQIHFLQGHHTYKILRVSKIHNIKTRQTLLILMIGERMKSKVLCIVVLHSRLTRTLTTWSWFVLKLFEVKKTRNSFKFLNYIIFFSSTFTLSSTGKKKFRGFAIKNVNHEYVLCPLREFL